MWGLGATLWEVAVGHAPFDDGDEGPEYPQLVRRAESIRRLRPRLPSGLAATIDASLEPDPRLRPRLDDVTEVLGRRVLGVPDLATVT